MAAPYSHRERLRVLIVRPTALGDLCRTVPALVTLRRSLPTARIEWLVHESFADAVRYHPALDQVLCFPRQQLGLALRRGRAVGQAWRWAADLRRRRFDLVIDLQGLFRSGVITWLTGAGCRVGYANARELAWMGYNHRHCVDPSMHTVDRMLSLLAAQGYVPHNDMRLYVGPSDRQWLDQFLQQHGVPDGRYATLAPAAQWRCKCWPIENYAQVARRLLKSSLAGQRLVVLASPSEHAYVKPLLEAVGTARSAVLIPRTTVGQLMALLSRTSLLVCNDSGPLHMAVGFDRPIVAVFGPTDPARVGPYHRDDTVVRPPGIHVRQTANYRAHRDNQSLIAQVRVEAVWAKVEEQLGKSHEDILTESGQALARRRGGEETPNHGVQN